MQPARHPETVDNKDSEHPALRRTLSEMTKHEQESTLSPTVANGNDSCPPLALSGATTGKYFQARCRGPERSHGGGNQFLNQIVTRC
jgi:hypothetical protein